MAQETPYAGEKMSLRSGPLDQTIRIGGVSNNLGSLGDFLVSTFKSAILSLGALAAPILIAILLATSGSGPAGLWHNLPAELLIFGGAIGLALNVLLVNPSQGNQIFVSWKYLLWKFNDNHNGEVIHVMPYRFTSRDADFQTTESSYKGHRRYITIMRVQGTVSPTSFDDDLVVLSNLNQASLKSLERDSVRTIINFIGSPNVQQKPIADNATKEMREAVQMTKGVVDSLGDIQSLNSYVVIDSPTIAKLRNKVRSQINYFNRGLVVTYQILSGDELKETYNKLFS